MNAQCDVLLVFVNNNEKQAVYQACKERYECDPVIRHGKRLTYHDFGTIGGARVWGLQIEMGGATPGGAAVSISDALNETKPQYVVLVGIAFGMDREKQRIGDILVSEQLVLYEPGKVGTGEKEEDKEIPRGDRLKAPDRILGKFKAWSAKPHWQGKPVRFGLILSGEKLIDNAEFRAKLKEKYPEAIGGDMEAAGAYAAVRHYNRDWIVVKAVSDYADGKKKQNKEKNQRLAARNAAQLVFHVLEKGGFGGSFFIGREKEEKEEEPPAAPRSSIRELVKENIIKLLSKRKMEHFRDALKHRLNKEKNEEKEYGIDHMAEILVNKKVLAAVSILDLAVFDCHKAVKDADASVDLINHTWEAGLSIVGWLVLLGVNEEWAEITCQRLAEKGEHLDLVIPVITPSGADIAFSRIKHAPAHLRIDRQEVKGEKGIYCDHWNIEDGWHTGDKRLTIKMMLWKQLIKTEPPEKGEMTEEYITLQLKQTILSRSKKGEHHYLAVDLSRRDNPLLEEEICKCLIEDLGLCICKIGTNEQVVVIIDEIELDAQLREFFRNKPEFTRK